MHDIWKKKNIKISNELHKVTGSVPRQNLTQIRNNRDRTNYAPSSVCTHTWNTHVTFMNVTHLHATIGCKKKHMYKYLHLSSKNKHVFHSCGVSTFGPTWKSVYSAPSAKIHKLLMTVVKSHSTLTLYLTNSIFMMMHFDALWCTKSNKFAILVDLPHFV